MKIKYNIGDTVYFTDIQGRILYGCIYEIRINSIAGTVYYIEDFFGFLNILKEQKVFDSEDALLNRHKQVDNDLEHVDKDLQEE